MDGQITVAERRQRLRSKLGPGKGLLDWIKLCRRFKQQNHDSAVEHTVVTFEELQKHNKEDDCWTAFRGDSVVANYVLHISFLLASQDYPILSIMMIRIAVHGPR